MNSTSTATEKSTTAWGSTLAAAGLAALGSLAANSGIAWVGRNASDTADSFEPLLAASFGPAKIAGAVAVALGWRVIVEHHRQAGRLLRWLTPTVLLLSVIPDVMLLVSDAEPGTTVGRVIALTLMHAAVGLVSVPLYRTFMPPRT